jgi:hypothetical protein
MAMWLYDGLEVSRYWQDVSELVNELLRATPFRTWTIRVRPKTEEDAREIVADQSGCLEQLWYARLDPENSELTVGVPIETCDVDDDGEPEHTASYIVFDLLGELVSDNDGQ